MEMRLSEPPAKTVALSEPTATLLRARMAPRYKRRETCGRNVGNVGKLWKMVEKIEKLFENVGKNGEDMGRWWNRWTKMRNMDEN